MKKQILSKVILRFWKDLPGGFSRLCLITHVKSVNLDETDDQLGVRNQTQNIPLHQQLMPFDEEEAVAYLQSKGLTVL